jgi:hypothetical protein
MYKEMYQKIMTTAKSENRIKGDGVYYETHHIVPDFMFKNRKRTGPAGHLEGDPNHSANLVLLTFQEHLMAHYYLYEALKGSHYEYAAGSALQFFFTHATGNHIRQKNLSEVDEKFLNDMTHLRQIGIDSISKAKQGKMPVVNALTREKIGSVPVNHPKVLSGEWVHHSKGRPGKSGKCQQGSNNNNFKEMTVDRYNRVINCVSRSINIDNYLNVSIFEKNLKSEFKEFKKISIVWIKNNFGSIEQLVETYNQQTNSKIQYSRYHKSPEIRNKLSKNSQNFGWVTNGINNKRLKLTDLPKFLISNKEYKRGRTI